MIETTMDTITTFFMWCTIINGSIYILGAVLCKFVSDFMYRIHNRYVISISREAFNVTVYASLGFLKILVLVFSLVPYLALLIIRQ